MFGWLARLLFNRDGNLGEAAQPSPDDVEHRSASPSGSWGGPSSDHGGAGSCDSSGSGGSNGDGSSGGGDGGGGGGGGDGGGGGSC